ncbi:hypothetical protein RHGRI_007969 [Rhododendron griersonianum]|uniref:DUF674 family protein n=1 Tax=Rhododendron griersonianum TaxID=479676 RepID=A0AAV6KZ23_9ERIC|nr:hypothetical protein RHGRI_007969 [Rhododendron griersonianum]
MSAPPLLPASSSPSFSDPIIGIIYNANCTTSLNSSTTTGSASNSTCKVLIVPGFADTNCTPSHESYSSPNDSHKKVSTTAPDSAPQTSTVLVQYTPAFSLIFLTLPVGTIIRLLEDKSPPTVIGCMNSLYKSIENLDAQLFVSEACKKMLLQLTRLPEVQCKNLKAMIEKNLEPNKCFYFCANSDCRTGVKGILSDLPNVRCHCGQVMNQLATLVETDSYKGNGGFVKRGAERFLILQLLQLSLVSKTPLTDWVQLKQGTIFPTELEAKDMGELLGTKPANSESKKMDLKLFFSQCGHEVLYAESGEDFVDFLFSFLTFPLGSILKLLGGKSSLGCADNLYSSVENFSTDNYFPSEEIERMLLSPKLAPFSACESQLLHIEESVNPQYMVDSCWEPNAEWFVRPVVADSCCNSFEGKFSGPLSLVNPKSSAGETTGGGGFVNGPVKFMVTDALAVTLLSPISITSYLADLNIRITDVGEKVVSVGENEALNLLKMALVSGKALTNVFKLVADQSVSE